MGWVKKVQNKCIDWASRNPLIFKYLSYSLNVLAVVIFVLWLLKKQIPKLTGIELEALFAVLSGAGVTLNQFNRKLYENSEYSPAEVLALGYVNNFLMPVIVQLKKRGETNPIICLYKPRKISELEDSNIENSEAELKNRNYTLDNINLDLKPVRARDILIIQKNATIKCYFDFPSTLLSLIDYIDYKIESKPNTSVIAIKTELEEILIKEFYSKLKFLLKQKKIRNNIKFCDNKLKIFK